MSESTVGGNICPVVWTPSEDTAGRSAGNEHARIGYVSLTVSPEGGEGKYWWSAGYAMVGDSGVEDSIGDAKRLAVESAIRNLKEMQNAVTGVESISD